MNFSLLNNGHFHQINNGSYGRVYCIENKGGKYALKIIRKDDDIENPENYARFITEINVLEKCHYPTIISLYEYKQSNAYMILTPYQEKGSLNSFFSDPEKFSQLNFDKRLIIGYGVALGMQYLHQNNISHRDLKPSHILLNENYYPIISGLGMSTLISRSSSICRTPLFCSPEVHLQDWNFSSDFDSDFDSDSESEELNININPYDTKKADVYSFGIVLYCLLIENHRQLIDFLCEFQDLPSMESIRNPDIRNLFQACCDINPNNRPNFDIIVEMMKNILQTNLTNLRLYEEFNQFIEDGKKSKKKNISLNSNTFLDGCFNLGLDYVKNKSTNNDYKVALKYFKIAGEQGHSGALLNIGLLYEKGYGVVQDYNKAKEYFEKAAEQGNSDALFNLGLFYENGLGVMKDNNKAK